MAFVQLLAGLEPVAAAGVPAGLLERRYGVGLDVLPATVLNSVQAVRNSGGGAEGAPAAVDLAASAAATAATAATASTASAAAPRPPLPDAAGWLAAAAARHTSGDTARMAQRLLDDFRRGQLGAIALELPSPLTAPPAAEPETPGLR
jgi:ribosome biogenesis GTPase A